MKSIFKLSALSLATLLAFSQGAQAAHHKQHHKQHHNAAPVVQPVEPIAEVQPERTSNWDPTPSLLPANQLQFMTWAQDINGGKSREHLFSCWKGMLCVSGLLDLDARYFNRRGEPFGPTGSTAGAGVRPLFGRSTNQLIGSVNNANVFVDLNFPEYVRIHTSIAYLNGSVLSDSYTWGPGADWGSGYRLAAGIHADELYAVFSDPARFPVYLKIGKMYADFGTYNPNGYGLPTITPSLTQLMTQSRTGGAQVGFAIPVGLYGSATWSMNQPSLGNFSNNSRNYSAKLGLLREFANGKGNFNVNLSYLWDIRDVDYMNDFWNFMNADWAGTFDPGFAPLFTIKRQHAFAGHADVKYGPFGLQIEGAATTGKLNELNPNSQLWTAGIDGSFDFPTLGHDSSVDLGYQIARHASYLNGTAAIAGAPFTGFVVGPFSNQMPARRIVGTYIFKVIPHVNTALQWVHDTDFGAPSGTDKNSDFGIFRIDLEF